jgi:DNA invertase Pin-like site-specific DNA recombinase
MLCTMKTMTGKSLQAGQMPGVRAAVYVRISSDRVGAGLGVARQEEDCRGLYDRLGWQVARVYSDNDVSATRAAGGRSGSG